jgi:hypothetical protein
MPSEEAIPNKIIPARKKQGNQSEYVKQKHQRGVAGKKKTRENGEKIIQIY